MSIQTRLIQTDGHAVFSGVQMVVKAGLESAVDAFVAAHLDSPQDYTELLADLTPLLEDKGVRPLVLPDARQAVAALQSAWASGGRAMGLIDSRGVIDAAAVLLAQRDRPGTEPGSALLCFGPSDTEDGASAVSLLRRAGWLVIEPSLQDEVKPFAAASLGVSRVSGLPVALALPAALLDGAATVTCAANQYPASAGEARATGRASENVEPLSAALAEARAARINALVNPPGKDEDLPLALITVGRSFGWARQAMAELGLAGRVPMLRLGLVTPPDEQMVRRHTQGCLNVLVLDPTGLGSVTTIRRLTERDTPALPDPTNEAGADADAAGDTDTAPAPVASPAAKKARIVDTPLAPDAGPGGVIAALRPWLESHPTLPRELVAAGLERIRQARLEADAKQSATDNPPSATPLPIRTHNPPPGSSLVDLSVVLGRLRRDLADAQHMLEQHRSGPIDLSVFGELDSAARLLLGRWSPLEGGLACDGRLAGAAAAGAAPDPARRAVVLMTSRRFFSLGLSAIADAVRAGRDAVFIIHTEDPAEALGPRRRFQRKPKVNALDMQAIVQAIHAGRRKPEPSVSTIDPSDRPRMRRLLERLVLSEGVHVVIARRRRGPRYYRKASEVHRKQSARRGYVAKQGCLVHCPEAGPLTPRRRVELGILGVEPTRPGPDPWTVSVSWSWHDDTVMHALGDPSVGLAILERSQPERSRALPEDLDDLPDPPRPIHANADAWRATLVGLTGTALDLSLDLLLEAGAAMGYLVRATHNAQPTDKTSARRADILFTRREPDNAPHVPAAPGRAAAPTLTAQPLPGHADLLLATELTEGARLIADPDSPMDPAHTHALIDTLLIPTLDALATGILPDKEALVETAQPGAQRSGKPDTTLLPIARLAEWFWGHQRYAAWVYLGYLIQRGLVPLTTTALNAAGQRVLGITDPRSAEAVRVGRKLATDPAYARRALQQDDPTAEALLKTLADDLAERAGSRAGTSLAGTFQSAVQPLLDAAADLDPDTRRDIVNTAQRCVYWAGFKQGPDYCQRFVDTLTHVLKIDDADHGYALTRAAVRGLEQAMLIPDEVYLAALLTAPARYRRDRRRLNISLERGDRISYVHILRPEFDLFNRRVGFTLTLGERALKTVARLHVIRRIRPGWYRTQRAFRDLYINALNDLTAPETEAAYRHARELIACTAAITGRGDTRRATAAAARKRLEKLIAGRDEA